MEITYKLAIVSLAFVVGGIVGWYANNREPKVITKEKIAYITKNEEKKENKQQVKIVYRYRKSGELASKTEEATTTIQSTNTQQQKAKQESIKTITSQIRPWFIGFQIPTNTPKNPMLYQLSLGFRVTQNVAFVASSAINLKQQNIGVEFAL